MGLIFGWILNGFSFVLGVGKVGYKATKFVISLPFYKVATARGKVMMGAGSLAITGYFTEDQYDMIAHMTVDKNETRTFRAEFASWMAGDISLARAGRNYYSGYGKAMLIHISLTAFELMPAVRMFRLGITNPTVVTGSKKLRESVMSKVDFVSFDAMKKVFKSKKYNKKDMDGLGMEMPAGQQKQFFDDINSYFSKLKPGGKNPGKSSFREIILNMSPKEQLASGAMIAAFSVYLGIWAQEHEIGLTTVYPKIAVNIKKTYQLMATNYNRFYQNPLMTSDIANFARKHKVSTTDGYGAYIELQLLGRDVIQTWYAVRDNAKPLFVAYINYLFKDIVKILDGQMENNGLTPQVVRLILAAMKSNDIVSFVKLITMSVIEHTVTKKKAYDGLASKSIPLLDILSGFGSSKAISDILNSDESFGDSEMVTKYARDVAKSGSPTSTKARTSTSDEKIPPNESDNKGETKEKSTNGTVGHTSKNVPKDNKEDIGMPTLVADTGSGNRKTTSMNDGVRDILVDISNKKRKVEV